MPNKKKNIANNFRGKEDIFFTKIKKGLEKFLEPPLSSLKNKKSR
tara:strand:+ start:866 stop:1000 length:135 start_codon:yes stop_codon:yes gene_type:complete